MTEATAASPGTRSVGPLGGLGHSRSVGRGPQRSTEHVLFRYEPRGTPPISFYSIPHGWTGGAETLDAARKIYRSSMRELFGKPRHELPRVVEHLEAVVAGMWVRTEMGAVHRDPLNDRMFLQTLLSKGPAQHAMQKDLERAETNQGAIPVVVIVEPNDSVGAVLDQLRGADTVLVVHSDLQNVLAWVPIYGPNAGGPDDIQPIPDDADLRTRPITFLTEAFVTGNRRAVRLQTCHLSGPA
jgi:hypothetical protein